LTVFNWLRLAVVGSLQDEVRVPKENLIGDVTCLLKNFVTERLGLALQANRFARVCR
jgi:alkylation response protein AidB-like acyl-CoA dehydrogenase